MTRCYKCKGNPFELGQYFMVHDNLWKQVCKEHHIELYYTKIAFKSYLEENLQKKI